MRVIHRKTKLTRSRQLERDKTIYKRYCNNPTSKELGRMMIDYNLSHSRLHQIINNMEALENEKI